MAAFEKAPQVDDDLRSIVAYTVDRWGVEQVWKYMTGLDAKMDAIATGQAHTTQLDHVIDGLKVGRYEHHYILTVNGIKRRKIKATIDCGHPRQMGTQCRDAGRK
jgi:plasmid stabilization system protein ParE